MIKSFNPEKLLPSKYYKKHISYFKNWGLTTGKCLLIIYLISYFISPKNKYSLKAIASVPKRAETNYPNDSLFHFRR